MSASDPSDPDIVDPLTDDPLAFLYEAGEEDEDEDTTADNPGYGSLMGLAVRRDGAGMKPAKAMAIVLDELEAQRAAEVMEINAGQLMTNPDRNRQVGFVGLGLDASNEEDEEDDLAESLTWETEEAEDDDWQPENPLAGTGIAEEDDDDSGWQPENPLAGTGIVQDDDDDDWQPENPLAGTGIVQHDEDDWQPENPLAGAEFVEQDDWSTAAQAPLDTAAPTAMPADYQDDDWNVALPAAPQMPDTPAAEYHRPEVADDEWDIPPAAVSKPELLPEEPAAAEIAPAEIEPPVLEAPDAAGDEILPEFAAAAFEPDPQPAAEAEAEPEDPSANPTIEWQALLVKKTGKKPVELPPIDWGEFAADETQPGEIASEPATPFAAGWADEAADELPALPPEPEWQDFAGDEAIEEAATDDTVEPALPAAAGEAADDAAGPYDTEWSAFASQPPAETPAPEPEFTYEPEFTADTGFEPEPEYAAEPEFVPESESTTEPEPPPVLEQIEIARFPAPPPVVPHHSLRARVMKAQQPRTPPAARLKPLFQWLAARFRQFVLPQLKRLFAWAGAKWNEIASRPPRD
jgi:hypothetical protein